MCYTRVERLLDVIYGSLTTCKAATVEWYYCTAGTLPEDQVAKHNSCLTLGQ